MLKKVVLLSYILCCVGMLQAQISKPDAVCTAANTDEVYRTRVIWRLGQLPYILETPAVTQKPTEERFEEVNSFHINVFPNPTSDKISIDFAFEEVRPVQIRLFDSKGNAIIDAAEPLPIGIYEYDISNLANGMYYLSISEGSEIVAQSKIIKTN